MPTLNDALGAFERHLGFPKSRARQVARRLQEEGLLPSGAPGIAPRFDESDFISLFLAAAADTTLHLAADAVRSYSEMTPGGADLSTAPPRIAGTARHYLAAIVREALGDESRDMRRLFIEVVSSWPEIAIHFADGSVVRFQPLGTLTGHWQNAKHRKSINVTGMAFVDAARALFAREQ